MGLEKRDKINYLRISDGKLRMKTTKEDPEAEERHDDINNKFLYERVYTSCEGYIRDIQQTVHDEYGVFYNITMLDPDEGEKYCITIAEASRYFQSFVMHLPNIDFSMPVKIKPYSFKKDGRHNIGITFEQGGKKVSNYYKIYDSSDETSNAINGLEDFDFSTCEDKHDIKIMQTRLQKFLVSELKKQIKRFLDFIESNNKTNVNIQKQQQLQDEEQLPQKKNNNSTASNKKDKYTEVKKGSKNFKVHERKINKATKNSKTNNNDDDLPF